MDITRLLLRRLKNRDRGLTRKPVTPVRQWPHLKRAAYHAQNLHNASSLKRLRMVHRPRWRREALLQEPVRRLPNRLDSVASGANVKDEDGVGFPVEETKAQDHCVGFAGHEIAQPVAFVSRPGW